MNQRPKVVENAKSDDLVMMDQKNLWHPLTQHKTQTANLPIVKAKDCLVYDAEGNEYIDAISSWYTCVYGHCNPYITDNVSAQMQELDQIVFSGFTHPPAIELSKKLLAILPPNQKKLFFSDNGSTAVEVAIKMSLQYHFNQGQKKPVLLAFENGFHGDTFGAMSVSGLSVYNGPFTDFSLQVERLPLPNEKNIDEVLSRLKTLAAEKEIAAFIYEPLVQGAAAMRMYSFESLQSILEFCKNHRILTVADEVMTGFGKTGKNFASDYLDIKPDIICLSKALTAGLLPMGLTSCTNKIFDAFLSEEVAKGFFHGHTYSANPLACRAAIAGIELLTSEEISINIKRIAESHKKFHKKLEGHNKIKEIRQLGVILAVDLNVTTNRYGPLRDKLYNYFMSEGVYLRPLGETIYILPPYTIDQTQLDRIYRAIEGVFSII